MPKQLPLPLEPRVVLTREDFVPSLASAPALSFIDAWPNWPVTSAALYGPSGSGKSHLLAIWAGQANAQIVSAKALLETQLDSARPLAIEDVDSFDAAAHSDTVLFGLLEHAQPKTPVVLTGHEPPSHWLTTLPDLASRFAALLSFPLWAPDDDLLFAIARKLFKDRQLTVPDAVIARMVQSLERSPSAIRDFVDRADARALEEGRPINLALVRQMMVDDGTEPSSP